MMNLLQAEDTVKGLPDQRLFQELQQPTNAMPQFLVLSELQRRSEMRKSSSAAKTEMKPPVAQQIMQEGIASLPQQPPAQRMAFGGLTGVAANYADSKLMSIPIDGRNTYIRWDGFPTQQAAFEAWMNGNLPPVAIAPDNTARPTIDRSISFKDGTLYSPNQAAAKPDVPPPGEPARMFDPNTMTTGGGRGGGGGGGWDELPSQTESAAASLAPRSSPIGYSGKVIWEALKKYLPYGGPAGPRFGTTPSKPEGGLASLRPVGGVAPEGVGPPVPGTSGEGIMGPPVPADYDADKARQRQDAEGVAVQGSILSRLMNKVGETGPSAPEFDDLVAQQNKDAFSTAMMQIGAGIASNDFGGGISRAAATAGRGREQARELEMQGRLLDYEGKRSDLSRDIDILKAGASVEAEKTRMTVQQMIQNDESDTAVLQFVGRQISNMLADQAFASPQEQQQYVIGLMKQMLPQRLLEKVMQKDAVDVVVPGTRKPLDSFG